jgi:hypothetical protein
VCNITCLTCFGYDSTSYMRSKTCRGILQNTLHEIKLGSYSVTNHHHRVSITLSLPQQYRFRYMLHFIIQNMDKIVPPFRQLYQETVSDLLYESCISRTGICMLHELFPQLTIGCQVLFITECIQALDNMPQML